MKAIIDFVIKAEVYVPDEEVDKSISDTELSEEIKNDIINDFGAWYGVKVTEVAVKIERTEGV
jgi:hypothetical protein